MTPIGVAGQSTGSVAAAAVVVYLEGERGDHGAALRASRAQGAAQQGAGSHYADSAEGPGP